MASNYSKALFAGGCFWCMEDPFEQQEGVHSVEPGYSGGTLNNPTYKHVSSGKTDHLEVVQVLYDESRITYTELLDIFWRQIDPTDNQGQFADRGRHYKTAIFYYTKQQKLEAEKSKKDVAESKIFKDAIVTDILPAKTFYIAEEYHRDYYKKQSFHYNMYKRGSGRASFIEKRWSK